MPSTTHIQNHTPRRDTLGSVIDCHDGCLEQFEGRYYLYGTRYGSTDGFTPANTFVAYASDDLAVWEPLGPVLRDEPPGVRYRPYVKRHPRTGQYVCWFNWYPRLWDGAFGVGIADRPGGPFHVVEPSARVSRQRPGDHGLFVDADGAAYLAYTSIEEGHAIAVERLSDDWMRTTGDMSERIARGCEAPALFRRGETYYLLCGNTCCFCPQGAEVRVYTASAPLGPFTFRGDINGKPGGGRTVPAQQTHVAELPSPTGPVYIWMGDCWNSAPDGIKGHDRQFWSPPLRFASDGSIEPLTALRSFSLPLS